MRCGSIGTILAGLLVLTACRDRRETPPSGSHTGAVDTSTTTGPIDTGSAPGPGVPVEVVEGGERTCVDPDARASTPWERVISVGEPDKQVWFWGGGVIAGDFNADGVVDVMLPGHSETFFYLGQPDGTLLATHQAVEGLDLALSSGGTTVDYDGDGDLDVFITRFQASNVLLRNDNGSWTDVTSAAGIDPDPRRSISSAWADYDGDGDLDLFVGCYGEIDESGIDHEFFAPADPSWLYRNEGDGTFVDMSDTLPSSVHDGYTFVGAWVDLDWDSRPELYLVNDFGEAWPNQLLWNRGDGVLDPDEDAVALDILMTGMGLGIGDVNGDGIWDFVMPEWNGIHLRESNALGFWVETAYAKGVYNDVEAGQKVGWGADMVDLDNDRDLDIAVAFGDLETPAYVAPDEEPDALFFQDDAGHFTDQAGAWGAADLGDGRGVVFIDINNDGWLDQVKRDLSGPTVLYRSNCGTAGWVRIRLHDAAPNTFAVGARVRVWSGGASQVRAVMAGGHGHASGGPPEVHFGLGAATTIDRVEILWPDGEISNIWDLVPNQVLDITRQ